MDRDGHTCVTLLALGNDLVVTWPRLGILTSVFLVLTEMCLWICCLQHRLSVVKGWHQVSGLVHTILYWYFTCAKSSFLYVFRKHLMDKAGEVPSSTTCQLSMFHLYNIMYMREAPGLCAKLSQPSVGCSMQICYLYKSNLSALSETAQSIIILRYWQDILDHVICRWNT